MHLQPLQQARPASRELALFDDSVFALYLGQAAARIFAHGSICHLTSGDSLTLGGPQTLTVVLEGVLITDSGWQGPGCHMIGDGTCYRVKSDMASVWVLDRGAVGWQGPGRQALHFALEMALAAAGRALEAAIPPDDLPDPETLSDVDHPQILRTAAPIAPHERSGNRGCGVPLRAGDALPLRQLAGARLGHLGARKWHVHDQG